MPTYVYRCESCGFEAEVVRSVADRDVDPPTCQHGEPDHLLSHVMTRRISATSFLLKGKGWEKDGYSS